MAHKADTLTEDVITAKSQDADLTLLGFHPEIIKHGGLKAYQGYKNIGNVLFVYAVASKEIK